MKMTWMTVAATILAGVFLTAGVQKAYGEGDKAAPASTTVAAGDKGGKVAATASKDEKVKEEKPAHTGGFIAIVINSGWFGVLVWLSLIACSVACAALMIDSHLTIREVRVAPRKLADGVREAISVGDLVKALEHCEVNPCPLSNILTAGFKNVEEGFEVVQDAVSIAADKEAEKMLQRVTYLSVISNTSPMLGLIGTVQGMIFAFLTLGTMQAGAAQQAMLAVNISHGLWATAVGLGVAVPAGVFYFVFKNRATRLILDMEALTLDLTKALRNVEVVEG